jgi:glycosyltransferase involved in cell wall biosynthesis
MTHQPLISCIIIFFNADEKFFLEAIASVFAQTYSHWELLLVDDGSTNDSTNIALDYAQKYPQKVRYLNHEAHQNRGMSATRNLGMLHANGEYIAFLDADDVWLSNTLEDQAAILDCHPGAAMVYGPIQWWYSWTGTPQDQQRDFIDRREDVELRHLGLQLNTMIHPPTLFLRLLQDKISISGMLIRRSIIEQVGGFEEEFRGLYEDQVFCSKLCLQFPVFVATTCWYKYRQHPDSCCNTALKVNLDKRPDFLNWLGQYVLKSGLASTEIRKAIQSELWVYRHPKWNLMINLVQRMMNRMKIGLIAQNNNISIRVL